MRKTVVVMFILLVTFATQAWTEPASKYPKTVAGLQALLDQYPDAIATEQKVIVEGKAPEWVATPATDCPTDLKVSVGALSYYLNSADEYGTPYATVVDGKILLNQKMSQYVFDDGFGQQSRDVQKAARSIREIQTKQQQELGGLTKSYDDLLSRSTPFSPVVIGVAGALTGTIFLLIFLNYREIKTVGDMKSGKTYGESEKETLKKVNASLEKHEGAVAKINDSFHGLRAEMFKHAERLRVLEGKPASLPKPGVTPDIAVIAAKPSFDPKELPPEWKLPAEEVTTNGNGVHKTAPTPIIPTPNTEEEPVAVQAQESLDELPLDPTTDLSILDKQAVVPQNGVQRILAEMNGGADQGEPTRQTKRPKTISLEEPQSSKEEQPVSVS